MSEQNSTAVLSSTEIALAGASSGFLTRALIQPFDVLKIRFQLQVEPIAADGRSKYTSMLQATSLICREEGVRALWKGHVPAQMLSVSFGLVQFWSFESLVQMAKDAELYGPNRKLLADFICGAVSGTAATIITFPFDIVRTRMIAQSDERKVYRGLWSGKLHLIRNEGFLALFKGLSPTVLSVALNMGSQFMFYNFFDGLYKSVVGSSKDGYSLASAVVSGSLSGLCSKTIFYPLDLIRKRLQIQGFQKYRRGFGEDFVCRSLSDCVVKIVRNEGPRGLFKGINPTMVKAVVSSGLTFATYEFSAHLILKTH